MAFARCVWIRDSILFDLIVFFVGFGFGSVQEEWTQLLLLPDFVITRVPEFLNRMWVQFVFLLHPFTCLVVLPRYMCQILYNLYHPDRWEWFCLKGSNDVPDGKYQRRTWQSFSITFFVSIGSKIHKKQNNIVRNTATRCQSHTLWLLLQESTFPRMGHLRSKKSIRAGKLVQKVALLDDKLPPKNRNN